MTCHRFKKDMLLEVYGELEARKRRGLEDHLAGCASCRREFETTRKVLASLDATEPSSTPEADWDRSWKAIEKSLEPARRRVGRFSIVSSWAYAPLALAALFILGIVVGRFALPTRPPSPAPSLADRLSPAAVGTLLDRYFENVTPVLLDYANDGKGQANENVLLSDRKTAASLLVENMLLRRALARKNPALADLFDDLDMILTDISHLKNHDTATPVSLREAINRRQVLDRIRRFETL